MDTSHQHYQDFTREFPARYRHEAEVNPKLGLESAINNMLEFMVLEKIPELDGRGGKQQISSFFKKFDAATSSWPKSKRIGALESKVSSRAERAFNVAINAGLICYEDVRQSMLDYLEELEPRRLEAFDELHWGVKRKLNEPIDDLAERISSLVALAFPGLSLDLLDDFSIKFLIRAMNNPQIALNLELKCGTGMSLDELVLLASRAEAVQKSFNRRQQQEESQVNVHLRVGQCRTSSRFSPKFVKNDRDRKISRMCYKCRVYGHYAIECPEVSCPRVFQLRTIEKFEGVDVDGVLDGHLTKTCRENEEFDGIVKGELPGIRKKVKLWTWHWRKKRRLARKVPSDELDEEMQKWIDVRMENWMELKREIDPVGRDFRQNVANGRNADEEEQMEGKECVQGGMACLGDGHCQNRVSVLSPRLGLVPFAGPTTHGLSVNRSNVRED